MSGKTVIKGLDMSSEDDGGWNIEGSTDISMTLFGNSLQTWAIAQGRDVNVDEAALAFNVTPSIIRLAVKHHAWMYLSGDEIEHEGY